MHIITWRETDGLHRSYATEAQASLILAMIDTDPAMALVSADQR